MAIAVIMDFTGVGQDKYEAAMKVLHMEMNTDPNFDGGLSHIAGKSDDGWTVVDVWESQEKLDTFVQNQLAPMMQEVGIPQPEIRTVEVYNHF